MKKTISVLLTVAFLLAFPFSFSISAAGTRKSSSSEQQRACFVSIYNDTEHTYLLENTKLPIPTGTTIFQTLELLKSEKLIADFAATDMTVTRIMLDEETALQSTPPPDATIFYAKCDGKLLNEEELNRSVSEGDVIEWIYGTFVDVSIPPMENQTTETKMPAADWTSATQKALQDGCDFLTLNKERSKLYLVALGCSGRTADVKTVNNLLATVRQNDNYTTAAELTKVILQLTFCGYDASDLVLKLTDFESAVGQRVTDSINALIAYDSKSYEIPSTALHSRQELIETILSGQHESGGFGINEHAVDNLDMTAMAITALSPYQDEPAVKKAIERAVQFLADSQLKNGGFALMTQENSESLSRVIVALSAVGIETNDERFVKQNKTLVDQLLSYKNSDGGFSHIVGDISTISPTEQAVIALSAVKKNDNPYKMLLSVSPKPQNKTEQVVETVKAHPAVSLAIAGFVLLLTAGVVTYSGIKKKRNKNAGD